MRKVAIIGTVGLPARYGGFETLAENLVRHHAARGLDCEVLVYCSAPAYAERAERFLSAQLRYVPLKANGVQSIPYDIWCMAAALREGCDAILLLGVSGAIVLPVVRALSSVRVVTNIDGLEWKRAKWTWPARAFLRLSERVAVRFSHTVVSDNQAIADHVQASYGRESVVIAYGGDHALAEAAVPVDDLQLPPRYALALCRIEPENNVHLILDAFSRQERLPLVFIGNWEGSAYGQGLRQRYGDLPDLHLLDPIYDVGRLREIRSRAALYVHGHSAGGTNPSLVEMMHFGVPIVVFDCTYNVHSTEGIAPTFCNQDELLQTITLLPRFADSDIGARLKEVAVRRYRWDVVCDMYFHLINVE